MMLTPRRGSAIARVGASNWSLKPRSPTHFTVLPLLEIDAPRDAGFKPLGGFCMQDHILELEALGRTENPPRQVDGSQFTQGIS